jgi:multidrug resistance efflux pump
VAPQRDRELELAHRDLQRVQRVSGQGQCISEESVDRSRTSVRSAEAALRAVRNLVATAADGLRHRSAALTKAAAADALRDFAWATGIDTAVAGERDRGQW